MLKYGGLVRVSFRFDRVFDSGRLRILTLVLVSCLISLLTFGARYASNGPRCTRESWPEFSVVFLGKLTTYFQQSHFSLLSQSGAIIFTPKTPFLPQPFRCQFPFLVEQQLSLYSLMEQSRSGGMQMIHQNKIALGSELRTKEDGFMKTE